MTTDDKSIAINALIDAVTVIEKVLGILPNGMYSDVRVRLDILEARINNPNSQAPNVTNPFYIDGYGGVSISVGNGVPTENRVNGSLYLRRDGYTNEGLYLRRDNTWALPLHVFPISDGYVGTFPSSITNYLSSGVLSASENNPIYVANSNGTIKNLVVTCTQIPTGAETLQIVIRKNQVDTDLSITLDSSSSAGVVGYLESNLINTANVALGDWLTIKCVSSAGAIVDNLKICFSIES